VVYTAPCGSSSSICSGNGSGGNSRGSGRGGNSSGSGSGGNSSGSGSGGNSSGSGSGNRNSSGSSSNSSGGEDPREYPTAIATRAEMLLLCVSALPLWWPDGIPRQQMAGLLARPVCHLILASVHLISNILIGQKQPRPDVALVMQSLLYKAVKVSAEVCSSHRGCVLFEMTHLALFDQPALAWVSDAMLCLAAALCCAVARLVPVTPAA
jgi:hypothetical protein